MIVWIISCRSRSSASECVRLDVGQPRTGASLRREGARRGEPLAVDLVAGMPGGFASRSYVPESPPSVIAAFRDAPVDDEPVTAEDERAMVEVQADRAAGAARISYAEVMRKHGSA